MSYSRISVRNRSKKVVARALVSRRDVLRVKERRWFLNEGYPTTSMEWEGKRRKVSLGRFVIGCSMEFVADHINRNKLDNRRENLRAVTQTENLKNRDMTGAGAKGIFRGTWIEEAIFQLPVAPSARFSTRNTESVRQAIKYLKKTGRINKEVFTKIVGNEVRVYAI